MKLPLNKWTKIFLVTVFLAAAILGFMLKLPARFRYIDKELHAAFYFMAAAFLNILFVHKNIIRHLLVFIILYLFGVGIEYAQEYSNSYFHAKIHGRYDPADIEYNLKGLIAFSILWAAYFIISLFTKKQPPPTKKTAAEPALTNLHRNQLNKSSIAEIKERFDNDVERFSNIDTGQLSTIDAKISLELITEACKRMVPGAETLLDIGCGAGNYSLMMLSKLPNLQCSLVDLSKPMLDKALERVSPHTNKMVEIIQADIREVGLKENHYDIILAGAVLHHLREDEDWETTFTKLYKLLKPGGCLMIADLVTQDNPILNQYTWERYGDYLEEIGGIEYRKKVLDYVAKEDSPRSINYQLDLMKKVGFSSVEILHKNMCFGAFGGIK